MPDNDIEFITTSEACSLLQVSKTIIKRMADQGELETWKTPGGHRRIKRESVLRQLETHNAGQTTPKRPNMAPQSLKILVIDNNEIVQKTFLSFAQANPFPTEVAAALNGFEGLIKAGKDLFDMVFIDLQIPLMDGYEAVNALREGLSTNASTIIVMTSYMNKEIDRDRLPVDVVLLNKPLNLDIVKQFMVYENSLKTNKQQPHSN